MNQPVNLARRNLLRGVPVTVPPPLRPPGAVEEPLFTERCTACGGCIESCPQGILLRGSGGFPVVDFSKGECTFCVKCVDVCAEHALTHPVRPPWRLELRVLDTCLAKRRIVCRSCGDACEPEAIRFRPRPGRVAVPEIDDEACTACGACVAACPESAIEVLGRG